MELAIPSDLINSPDQLGVWAKAEFNLPMEPRAPRASTTNPERVKFLGEERTPVQIWVRIFSHPNGRLRVEYVEGSASVSVREEAKNIWGFIKHLHKGSGMGIVWILFLDTIAGALIAMTITGFLLWSRLHGTRLLALGIIGTSVVAAFAGVYPFLL